MLICSSKWKPKHRQISHPAKSKVFPAISLRNRRRSSQWKMTPLTTVKWPNGLRTWSSWGILSSRADLPMNGWRHPTSPPRSVSPSAQLKNRLTLLLMLRHLFFSCVLVSMISRIMAHRWMDLSLITGKQLPKSKVQHRILWFMSMQSFLRRTVFRIVCHFMGISTNTIQNLKLYVRNSASPLSTPVSF